MLFAAVFILFQLLPSYAHSMERSPTGHAYSSDGASAAEVAGGSSGWSGGGASSDRLAQVYATRGLAETAFYAPLFEQDETLAILAVVEDQGAQDPEVVANFVAANTLRLLREGWDQEDAAIGAAASFLYLCAGCVPPTILQLRESGFMSLLVPQNQGCIICKIALAGSELESATVCVKCVKFICSTCFVTKRDCTQCSSCCFVICKGCKGAGQLCPCDDPERSTCITCDNSVASGAVDCCKCFYPLCAFCLEGSKCSGGSACTWKQIICVECRVLGHKCYCETAEACRGCGEAVAVDGTSCCRCHGVVCDECVAMGVGLAKCSACEFVVCLACLDADKHCFCGQV